MRTVGVLVGAHVGIIVNGERVGMSEGRADGAGVGEDVVGEADGGGRTVGRPRVGGPDVGRFVGRVVGMREPPA